jgi:hypothetical protein
VHRHCLQRLRGVMYSPTRTPLTCPSALVTARGFGHSLSLRFSRQLC